MFFFINIDQLISLFYINYLLLTSTYSPFYVMILVMYPYLFSIGSVQIGSYGLILACAFLSAFLLVNYQFKKNGCDIDLAWDLHFFAISGGMVGSKIMYILENLNSFFANPTGMIFSTTGFSVLGGYVLAVILCVIRVLYEKTSLFQITDLYTPGMALGYAIGRLGCIASGDGCYGIPCKVPWAMSFPKGLVPTLSAENPMLTTIFQKIFPGESIPTDIYVHPTPLYESISAFVLLLILLSDKWQIGSGSKFGFFLTWFGISRFLIEFIRLNPIVMWGLSSSQLLSIVFILAGIILMATAPARLRKLEQSA